MRIYQYLLTGLALASLSLNAHAYTEFVDSYDDGVYETSSGSYIVSETCYVDAFDSKVTISGVWMTFKNGKKCRIDEEYDSKAELLMDYYGKDADEIDEDDDY